MENEITDAQSDQMLMDGLKAIYDSDAESGQVEQSAQETPVDRGTQEPEEKPKDNGAVEPAKQEPTAIRASNSESESQKNASVEPVKTLSPSEQRKQQLQREIQEVVALRNKEKAELEAIRKEKASLANPKEPQKPIELVERPKPTAVPIDPETGKPFSRQELERAMNALQDKADAGEATVTDHRNLRYLNGLMHSLDMDQIRLEQWELKNGQEVKSFEEKRQNFNRIAEEKMPELKNPDSPLSKVTGNLNDNIDKWLKGPERRYYVSEIANLLVGKKNHDAELGARNKEIETLKKELQTYKGKFAPARQVVSSSVGEASEADDPNWLLNNLKEIAPKGFI